MRILTVQSAIVVSLAVAGVTMGAACSSSDAPGRGGDAGATATGGAGNTGGATPGGGSGNVGNTGNTGNTGGSTPGAGAGGASAGAPATGGSGGAAGPSVCDAVGSRVLDATPEAAFIDDFECAVAANCNDMMVNNGWYGFSDLGPKGADATDSMFKITQIPAGKFGKGGNYTGTGANTPVSGGFGVGLEINLGSVPAMGIYCVDASAFKGVSFWARADSATNNKITVGFVVPSQNNVQFGGDCPDATPAKCNNFPQKPITLTADWQQYTVEFAGLKGTTGATVVGGKVQQLLFLAPTADWNFSLDEIAYYIDTPPAGAVAPPAAP